MNLAGLKLMIKVKSMYALRLSGSYIAFAAMLILLVTMITNYNRSTEHASFSHVLVKLPVAPRAT